jgi:hypothetical protein
MDPRIPTTPPSRNRRKRASFMPKKGKVSGPGSSGVWPRPIAGSSEEYLSESPPGFIGELTFWDTERRLYHAPSGTGMLNYERLSQRYPGLTFVDFLFPWMVLYFEDELLHPSEQPFSIGGLIAVFLPQGEPYPFGI